MKPARSHHVTFRVSLGLAVLLAGAGLHAQQPDPLKSPAPSRTQERDAGITVVSDAPAAERGPALDESARPDPRVERAWLEEPSGAVGEPPPKPDLAKLGASVQDRAFHGAKEDGSPWVRGSTYQAGFSARRASFTPFLGSDAPRSWPVGFELADVSIGGEHLVYDGSAIARRDGERVSYDRGSVTERYEICVDSIEQVFVFDELPSRGEIVLRVAFETDLVARDMSAGIEFSNELGGVRFGRATALDADGASVPATTTLVGDEIEIHVPAEFVATARLPLVVDPLISTFTVGPTGPYARMDDHDCAFDSTFGRWLVTYVDRFDVAHVNIVWRLIGLLDGQTIASGIVAADMGFAPAPRCANNNATNQFLVVWHMNDNSILARSVSAADGALGPQFTISGSQDFTTDHICVGGDPYPSTPSHFLVVWFNARVSPNATDTLRYKLVDANGTLGPMLILSSANNLQEVSVSKSNGGSKWNVVRRIGFDIIGAQIAWNGTGTPSVQFGTGLPKVGLSASMALDGSNLWAFTYAEKNVPDDYYWHVRVGLVDGLNLVDDEDLSRQIALTGGQVQHSHQQFPEIDSDGRSFAITYTNSNTQVTNVWSDHGSMQIATVAAVGNRLHLSETRTIDPQETKFRARIASTRGAGLSWRLQLAVYSDTVTGTPILGALYDNALYTDFCQPGYDNLPNCPCGNPPVAYGRGCNNPSNTGGAKMYPTGISSVSSDSMMLTVLNLPTNQTVLFYQGTSPLTTAAFSGQGIRCIGGTLTLLYTKPSYPLGTQAYALSPSYGEIGFAARSAQLGMPIVAGQTRYYYASYRTTGTSGGGSGIPACATPFAANASQSVQAIWIP